MTPHAGPLSENGKVLLFAFLFPIFWPFIPVLLIVMAVEKIQEHYWIWQAKRAAAKQEADESQ